MKTFGRLTYSIITGFVCLMFACQGVNATTATESSKEDAEWTILIFMNADNNLEYDAINNFKQAAKVGSTDLVNVVVQFDRSPKYAVTDPDWTQTLRFRITKDMEPIPANAIEDLGEVNMGDPAVLSEFVRWGMQRYPAKRYMLVMWDHGQGWRVFLRNMLNRHRTLLKSRALGVNDSLIAFRNGSLLLRNASGIATVEGDTAPFRSAPGSSYRSISHDETNHDVLYNREIQDTLTATLAGTKLDVIGFDACLMSMAEAMYAMKGVAHYFVGSEELEPARGWNYEDWLTAIMADPRQDAAALAKATVASYQRYYTSASKGDPETTLSAVDLAQVQPLATSLSRLSDSLTARIDAELQAIIEARAATATYAPGYEFHHVDLAHFLNQLKPRTSDPEIRNRIDAVLEQIRRAVIANYAGAERQGAFGSNGIAIYFPRSQNEYVTDPFNEGGYEKNNDRFPVEFVQQERWSDFLHTYWSRKP